MREVSWDFAGAAPRWATLRNPTRHTEGGAVSLIADALGSPLLPWQRYTADVAGELAEDGSYVYPVVVVTVPRQSGKTTLLRAMGTHRGLAHDGTGVFYSAQTGKDARERWQDLVATIKDSPLAPLAQVRSAAGSERVVWPNGSTFRAFAPTPKSLHGYTPPLVMLDEAFAHDEQLGNDLMGAIGPAQITVRNRQLWIVSTAGTAESVFLHRWIDAGRAGSEGVALFDWGVPDGVDVYDSSLWSSWHPGMVELPSSGEPLVTVEALRAQADQLSRSEFTRAFGNRRTRTASHLIAAEAWDRLGGDVRPPVAGAVFAWDVMDDRSAAAITASWREAGQLQSKVVRTGPGMAWVAGAVTELHGQGWRTFGHAADGPAREVGDELAARKLAGLEIRELGGREYADAWGGLMRHIAERTLRHDGSEQLATAAANVATRPTMDSAAPSRRNSAGDITALVALMVSAYVLDHKPAPLPALDYEFAE